MDPLGQIQAKKIVNRISIFNSLLLLATAAVSLGLGFEFEGSKGIWGSSMALIVLLAFSLFTPLTFRVLGRKKMEPKKFIICVTGSWFLKLVLVFVALIILGRFTFFNRAVFAETVFFGAVAALAIEFSVALFTGLPRKETERKDEEE